MTQRSRWIIKIVAVVLFGFGVAWLIRSLIQEKGMSTQTQKNDISNEIVNEEGKILADNGLPQSNVVIVMDASLAMQQDFDGVTKLAAAKEAIARIANTASRKTNVSVLAYGHKGSAGEQDKAVSCAGIEEMHAFGKNKPLDIQKNIESVSATGYSALHKATLQAVESLASKQDEENLVLVVIGGKDTCDDMALNDVTDKIAASNVPVYVLALGLPEEDTDVFALGYGSKNGTVFSFAKRADMQAALESGSINTNGLRPAVYLDPVAPSQEDGVATDTVPAVEEQEAPQPVSSEAEAKPAKAQQE